MEVSKAQKAAIIQNFTDPRWRLSNLYYITDENGQVVPFRMNWAQEALFSEMHSLNLILKARQLGMTTFIQLFCLDSCLWIPNTRAGVIAHNQDDAKVIFRDKVKFPYEHLPEGLRNAIAAKQDRAEELVFANNSSIRVATSMRSGTLQILHVSEYGKIAAKYPDKSREIRTGAFNAVHAGNRIFVESTAEGEAGDFYDLCENAQARARRGMPIGALDFKFHFYPWWKHPTYRLNEPYENTQKFSDYFAKLETLGIILDDQQKAWYVAKAGQVLTDMKREYPSTPDEAFAGSIEGSFYGEWMVAAEEQGRITRVAFDPSVPVETWWDLGISDLMSIWFVQRVGLNIQVIDHYQNSGHGFAHYANVLQEKQRAWKGAYNHHVWPHDGNARVQDETGRNKLDIMRGLGFEMKVVERGDPLTGIDIVRQILPRCWFDAERCADGIKAMKNYRKEWDDLRGTWKTKPLHDDASHAADAFRTGAMFVPPVKWTGGALPSPQLAIV